MNIFFEDMLKNFERIMQSEIVESRKNLSLTEIQRISAI